MEKVLDLLNSIFIAGLPPASVDATADAVPSDLQLPNGGTLTVHSYATGIGYTPSTPSNWPNVPVTVQQALDDLAMGTSLPLTSTRTIYVNLGGSDITGNGTD